MPKPSVAILGAGLGGLTLGRCLLERGIPSVIYESNERARLLTRHNYGITLQAETYKRLLDVLSTDQNTFRRSTAVGSDIRNAATTVSMEGAPASSPIRVNRKKLVALLQRGQGYRPSYNLTSAQLSEVGRGIELTFENGETLWQPELVVDALGVHSSVRQSLLPNVSPEIHEFVVYRGTRCISKDLFSSKYAPGFGDKTVIVHSPRYPHNPRLQISVDDPKSDASVSISYVYSRPARNKGWMIDPLHKPDRPNASATEIPESFYEELHQFIHANRSILSDVFIDCFDIKLVHSDRVLHWLMRSVMVPKEDLLRLTQQGVMMIGDAVHAVPVLGGHGANMAILDAIELAEVLTKQIENESKDMRYVKQFYEEKWDGWNDAVEQSKRALAEMHEPPQSISPSL